MKYLFTILMALTLFGVSSAQEQTVYKRVQISLEGKTMQQLAATGIDVTEGSYKKDLFLVTDLSVEEINRVVEAGFSVKSLIEDVGMFYRQRIESEAATPINRDPSVEFPVPANWEYGSMGGFYTYDQVLAKLDFMASQWPELITLRQPIDPLNPSHLGNPVWFVKISDNPNETEDEPQVLYTSLIHAREGIGVQQMIYFMLHLLENYASNPEIQSLVNSRELYFVPVANPDGYLYNQQTDPGGGGMWRKNRRNNIGSFGVDINRNFGYKWGLDNNGSSPNPSDLTYRGPAPFSEPETSNLKTFAENHEFKIALNYHSYSNLLLYPWGYTDQPCPDDAIFYAHATMMTRDNHYVYGPGSSTIYPTNGGSDDYMYGDTENKNAIFSYTPEVGNDGDGFWPSINRIIPLCQENMIQNMLAAHLSGNYASVTDKTDALTGQRDFYFHFDLQRLGFGNPDNWIVSISPLDDHIVSVGDPVVLPQLGMLEIVSDSILINLQSSVQSGTEFRFLLTVDNGETITTDTITKMFGNTLVLLDDACDQTANWTTTGWGITTSSFVSAPASITDSPFGEYGNNANSMITLSQMIELPETPYANLSFWAKWEIEAGWDYVQLLIKPSGSLSWTPLAGKYTKAGNSNQLPGQPLYDGSSAWVKEEIDLTPFAGTAFQLRFVLTSDGSVTEDGFYFDDMKIVMLNVETALPETSAGAGCVLFPNPAAQSVTLVNDTSFETGEVITVTDIHGKIVLTQAVFNEAKSITLPLNKLAGGVYFVRHNATSKPVKLIVE